MIVMLYHSIQLSRDPDMLKVYINTTRLAKFLEVWTGR
jgi:hypothetical protein